ncbi:hypothetical protein JZU46_04305 [bacterium]|nr:hypothetical protein [bacterium]
MFNFGFKRKKNNTYINIPTQDLLFYSKYPNDTDGKYVLTLNCFPIVGIGIFFVNSTTPIVVSVDIVENSDDGQVVFYNINKGLAIYNKERTIQTYLEVRNYFGYGPFELLENTILEEHTYL